MAKTEKFADNGASTLASSMTSGATTLSVVDATNFPTDGNFRVQVENEVMLVTAVSGTTFTVTRAQEGTTAASHASGLPILHNLTAGAFLQLLSEYTIYDAIANIPTAERAGRIFRATDSFLYARDNGSSWDYFAFGMPVTLPVPGNFTWLNQGSASVITSQGTMYLNYPDIATTDNLRVLYLATPTPPYTATLGCIPNFNLQCVGDTGIVLYDSVSGKLKSFSIADKSNTSTSESTRFSSFNYTNTTTYAGTFSFAQYRNWRCPLFWLRIVDDNTNRIFYTANDGFNWNRIYTETRTTYLTPNNIGVMIDPINVSVTGFPSGLNVVHWSLTTP